MQVVLVAVVLWNGEQLTWHSNWLQYGFTSVLGAFIAQLGGNALTEEVVFRGYFLSQFYGHFQRLGWRRVLVFALLGSAGLFAVLHLPNRWFVKGIFGFDFLVDQAQLILAGVLLGIAYVATRNLMIVIGMHAFINQPVPLVQASNNFVSMTCGALFLLTIAGFVIVRCKGNGNQKEN